MQRHLKPIGHCILVKLPPEKVSKGGIVLTTAGADNKYRKATQEAYIVSLGSKAFREFDEVAEVKVGDLVKISKYSGTEDDKDIETGHLYRLISDADVLGVYEGEEYCE
jgi:co-chaperonin GroES (HSP10)